MTKTRETQLAEHELRISAIESYHHRIEDKLDQLIDKIDNKFVTKEEYEKDMQILKNENIEIKIELDNIRKTMVTKQEMNEYQRSQFWQRFMSVLGGIGIAIITGVVMYLIQQMLKS